LQLRIRAEAVGAATYEKRRCEMASIENQDFDFECPNPKCEREFPVKFGDAFSVRRARCPRCNTEIAFDSSAVSNLRGAASDLARAQEKLSKAVELIGVRSQVKLGK
jgi:hypothetical protein